MQRNSEPLEALRCVFVSSYDMFDRDRSNLDMHVTEKTNALSG